MRIYYYGVFRVNHDQICSPNRPPITAAAFGGAAATREEATVGLAADGDGGRAIRE